MADQFSMKLVLKVTEEEREDRWAVKCLDLGIIVYGESQEDAMKAFNGAVKALVHSFDGDKAGLRAWLDKKGVLYQIINEPDHSPELAPADVVERLLEVAVGTPA